MAYRFPTSLSGAHAAVSAARQALTDYELETHDMVRREGVSDVETVGIRRNAIYRERSKGWHRLMARVRKAEADVVELKTTGFRKRAAKPNPSPSFGALVKRAAARPYPGRGDA